MINLLQQAQQLGCTITVGRFIYNPKAKTLHSKEGVVDIEPRSIELLEVLLTSIGQPVSGDEIIQRVWQSEYISKNVLTNRISTLRALFKQKSSQGEPDKVIITYPKKGYYLQADQVSLNNNTDTESSTGPDNADNADNADKTEENPSTETAEAASNSQLHLIYLSIITGIIILGIILAFSLNLAGNSSEPVISEPSPSTLEERATIPVVEIFMNRLKVKDESIRPFVKDIKAITLSRLLGYPYIDIKNQDSPTYFLDPIDDSVRWPGSSNILDYDYKLNISLSLSENPEIILASTELIYKGSSRLALKAQYNLRLEMLNEDIQYILQDLAVYLSLPTPAEAESNSTTRAGIIVHGNAGQVIELLKQGQKLTRLEAEVVARRALLSFNLEDKWIKLAIKKIDSSFQYPSEEITVWLGLLNDKVGESEAALEYLKKHRSYDSIHNAYLYTVLSSLSLRTEQTSDFRLFYLKSIEALSEAIPSEQLFRRLSLPENKQSCFQPWAILKYDAMSEQSSNYIHNRMQDYCSKVDNYLQKNN